MNPAMPGKAGDPASFDIQYPPGTIGADPALRQRIQAAMAELGRAREECFGYAAYRAVVAGFKRDFCIASYLPWTVIWDWPTARSGEILNYLEGRYAEAVGRPAARRPQRMA